MAELTQTTANVAIASPSARIEIVQVGESVSPGMPGYRAAAGKWYKAANTSATLAAANAIYLTGAATDGYAIILRGDGTLINLGATLQAGKVYVVASSGKIIELSELVTGKWITHLGTAISADLLKTKFNPVNTQVP